MPKKGAKGWSSGSWISLEPASGRVLSNCAVLWFALMLLQAGEGLGVEAPEDGFVESKVVAASGARGDELGWSVAIDGNVLVVGAVNADTAGRVYVFAPNEQGDWEETAILRPTADAPNASFGNAVDIDGDAIVVGAPRDQESAADVGAVYVFRRTAEKWGMEARLVASDGVAGDRFGESVSIHADRLAVGAPSRDEGGENAGAVYVFAGADGLWIEEAKLLADGAGTGSLFGTAVGVGAGLIVVGAPTDTGILNAPGAAYIFERNAERWVQRSRVTGAGSPRDLFGLSVGVDARTIVVGGPRTAAPLPVRPGGSVHVFEEMDSRWLEQAELQPPDPMSGDRFGFSVSISGGTVVASAVDLCSIYVFRRDGVAWRNDSTLLPGDGCQASFGRAVDVGGDTILAGSPSDGEQGNSAGAAYVYETQSAEVILGLGTQSVVAGQEGQLALTYDSRALEVASFRYEALLPSDLSLEPATDGVDCWLEKDLADDFALSAIVSPDPVRLRIELTALDAPAAPLPRDGLIGRCRVRVGENAIPGDRPLACNSDAAPARATDPAGEVLPTRCEDGELTILPPCIGDCDASGGVSVDELLIGMRVALDSESIESCRALDLNRDYSVSIDELVGAVAAALEGCERSKP